MKRGNQEQKCFDLVYKLAVKKNDEKLLPYWNLAKPNPDSNAFPDFIFQNGFIEHFQVSAAQEGKKGSAHNRVQSNFERENKKAFDRAQNNFLQSPPRENAAISTCDLTVLTHEMPCPEYSYDNFIYSFKRNLKHHMLSLKKYEGNKSVGIFLIELVGARITVKENGKFKKFYSLQDDCDALDCLQRTSKELRYIVFANNDGYELIDTREVPALRKNIHKGLSFNVGRYKNIALNLLIDF